MPAARYWRLVGIETYGGGDLALSELHLRDANGRIDAVSSLSCSHPPAAGALADLTDEAAQTGCSFTGEHVRSGGFWLRWEFLVDASAVGIELSGMADSYFMAACTLQCSADMQTWDTVISFNRITYLGDGELTLVSQGDPFFDKVASLLPCSASTGFSDVKGRVWTASTGAQISTSHWPDGAAAFSGDAKAWTPRASDLEFRADDFCIEFDIYPIAMSHQGGAILGNWGTTVGSNGWLITDSFGGAPDRRLTFVASPDGSYTSGSIRHFYGGGSDADAQLLLGQWQRVSVSRVGGVFYLTVRGKVLSNIAYPSAITSGTFSIYTPNEPVGIHHLGGTDAYEIKKLRITVGWGRYSSDYTPDTFPHFFARGVVPPTMTTERIDLDCACAASTSSSTVSALPRISTARDVEFGGKGQIWGSTKTKGASSNTPTKSRVRLQRDRDGLLARQVWSDPSSGAFQFVGIDPAQKFTVLAEDAAGNFRAVAANRLTPEVP